jgi:TolA-binding protein
MEGDYAAAEEAFREVYLRADAAEEQRAEALFSLGETAANVLTPRRDEEQAAEYFRKLVAEFPDSDRRAAAEERLRGLNR